MQTKHTTSCVMRLQTDAVILFVGTKKQAADAVAEEAVRAGQYFTSHRWLGGGSY